MLGSIKVSVKDTVIYGLGNVAVKVVGLILIPLYTNKEYFSVDDFGRLGLLEVSALVLTAVLASSLPQSLTRWYWDKEHVANQKGIFFMSFVSQLVISVVLCLLLLPLSGTFSELMFGKADWTRVIAYVIIGSGLQAINNIINTLMRLQSRAFLYTFTNLIKLLVVLSLTVYFILNLKMGLEGIYLAQVIGNILFIVILSGYSTTNSTIDFNKTVFREMSIYGFPLLLANISAVLLNVIDRYSLNSLAILKYVALYTMAFKVTSVLKLVVVDSIKLAVAPLMIKKISSPDNSRFYSKILLYTSFVLMLGILFISLFSLEIIKVLSNSKELWGAVVVIPILSLSIFFINMKEITVYGLHIVKKTKIIGSVVVITTILSLLLNIVLIPLWDITGSAIATLLSQLIYFGIIFYYAQKNYFIPYEYRKLIILFLLGTLFSFSSLFINDFSLIIRLVIKSSLFLCFPFILYFFRFYDEIELQAISGFVRKWKNLRKLKENLASIREIKNG
jgi:O-antigen/teichoic acid export membrane protein